MAAGETGAVQLAVKLKSAGLGPLRVTEEMSSGAFPEFVTVSVCAALEVPSVVEGNDGAAGEKETAGTVAMPVPLRRSVWGEDAASSVITRFAARDPAALGVKTSEIVQLADGATGAPQLFVKLKSEALGPLSETEETCNGAVPVFMTVSVCAELEVPCVVEGKDSAVGESVTAGAAGTPVPLRARVCGLPGALSATWRLAVNAPALAGLKLMLTEQLALGARVARQVLV